MPSESVCSGREKTGFLYSVHVCKFHPSRRVRSAWSSKSFVSKKHLVIDHLLVGMHSLYAANQPECGKGPAECGGDLFRPDVAWVDEKLD